MNWKRALTRILNRNRLYRAGYSPLRVEEFEPRVVPSGNPSVPLGANVAPVTDWSMNDIFVDMMKQARPFTSLSGGSSVPATVDADGWPTQDFQVILQSGALNTAHIYDGTYHLSFTGQATVSTAFTAGGSVSNLNYNSATNTTTADVTLNASDSDGGWYFVLDFSNTNGGVKNIRVISPGYNANTTQVFTNNFLNAIAPFSTLRFMDFTETNNSLIANWGDRSQVTDAEQSSAKGVAWEYVIQLANLTHKDIWVNIPVNATDDYVTQLATLMKTELNPGINIYVEYGNEMWNGAFTQTQINEQDAVAEVEAGMASGQQSPLFYAGETQQNSDGSYVHEWDWAWRRVAQRLVQISNDFASVWGASAIDNQIRPVLASQIANPYILQTGLQFIQNTYGQPSHFIYAVAGAPYFNLNGQDSNTNLTVDQIISAMSASLVQVEQWYPAYTDLATYYGLQDMAYEGGPDTGGSNNVAAKAAASLDPRMQQLVQQYLDAWYSAGGGLFEWYYAGMSNYNTPYGTWGLTNDITNLNTPKMQGIETVLNSSPPPITAGTLIPAVISANNYVGAPTTSDPYPRYLQNGNTLDYLINAPTSGTYSLAINYAAVSPGEQLEIILNDNAVQTLTLPVTGPDYDSQGAPDDFADSQPITLNLNQGLSVVRLEIVQAGFTINQLKFTGPSGGSGITGPKVVTPASASPNPVTGTTAALSVLGSDPAGEAALTYTWATAGDPPASVSFSANGTNASKNTTATFTKAGNYTLVVTLTDPAGLTATSTVAVTVNQTLTAIVVAPANVTLADGATQQFAATADDQFGAALATQPSFTWSVTGLGSVTSAGLYTAPVSGTGTATVSAAASGVSGSAAVTVTSGSSSGPNYPNGFAPPTGLKLNGSAVVAGTRLRLTDGGGWEGGSAFATTTVGVATFNTQFQFQLSAGAGAADGFAFVIQPLGTSLVGGYGSDLGYAGIPRSVAVTFDLGGDGGPGPDATGLSVNGASPGATTDLSGTGIDLHSGHVFAAAISYDGATLRVTITDTVTGASASQNYTVNIPGVVGAGSAYVGFTAATGNHAATQDILNWTYSTS
jgi:Legume lectin domain/PKD domain